MEGTTSAAKRQHRIQTGDATTKVMRFTLLDILMQISSLGFKENKSDEERNIGGRNTETKKPSITTESEMISHGADQAVATEMPSDTMPCSIWILQVGRFCKNAKGIGLFRGVDGEGHQGCFSEEGTPVSSRSTCSCQWTTQWQADDGAGTNVRAVSAAANSV